MVESDITEPPDAVDGEADVALAEGERLNYDVVDDVCDLAEVVEEVGVFHQIKGAFELQAHRVVMVSVDRVDRHAYRQISSGLLLDRFLSLLLPPASGLFFLDRAVELDALRARILRHKHVLVEDLEGLLKSALRRLLDMEQVAALQHEVDVVVVRELEALFEGVEAIIADHFVVLLEAHVVVGRDEKSYAILRVHLRNI